MKSKIILIVVLLITLLCSTIVFATDDLELDVRTNINVNELVGEEILDGTDLTSEGSEYDIMPISLPEGEGIPIYMPEDDDFSVGIPEEYWRGVVPEEYWRDEVSSKRGDIYVVQDNYTVEEYVDGNLFVIADQVEINADVDGNIFVLANNVSISGYISGSAFIVSRFVYMHESAQIKDAYFACSNDIIISDGATITREAKMAAETIIVSGAITGDLYSNAETIIVRESGLITGKAVHSGTLSQAIEGQVGSPEKYEYPEVTPVKTNTFANKATNILFKTFTALLIIGLIVLASNRKAEESITVVDCVKGVLGGIMWVILIPIIVVILMITIVGIPFSLIILTIYILMFFVAVPAMSLQFSAYVLKQKNKDSKVLLWLLATVIYGALAILRAIPVLGGWISILVGLYGFNLIVKTLFLKKRIKIEKEPEAVVVETKEDK